MRWLGLSTIGLAVILLGLLCIPASAATSDTVLIKCTGYVCDAPGGFTVTYISDYEVGVSWTKGEEAENTMVRACIGRFPANRNDGYEVYYGGGTTATDWVNMETLSEPIYYKAWSQRADGLWEELGSDTGFARGAGMILIAFIVLALGFTISCYVFRKTALAFGASGAWALLGFYSYTLSTFPTDGVWDIYYGFFWLCMSLVIVSAFEPLIMRAPPKELEEPEELTEEDELRGEYEKLGKEMENIRLSIGDGRRRPRGRWSRFARRGEE